MRSKSEPSKTDLQDAAYDRRASQARLELCREYNRLAELTDVKEVKGTLEAAANNAGWWARYYADKATEAEYRHLYADVEN